MVDLWQKCPSCQEMILIRELERNLKVCPKCIYHFPIPAKTRIELTVDPNSFTEYDMNLEPLDPLGFKDTKRYSERLKEAQEKTGLKEAFIYGKGSIGG